MPDIFAGLSILAAALLIVFYPRLTWPELSALWVLLACSMLFHRSHVLAAWLLLVVVALWVLLFARSRLRQVAPALGLIGAAVGIAAVGFIVVDIAVSKWTGRVATPPPFLLARVIEDGPGTSYLREACTEQRFVVCRFVDRMPIPARDFLWSKEPGTGVWYVVSPEDQIQIAEEQYPIVMRSFVHAPLTQSKAFASNFGRQLINFSVLEFAVGDRLRRFMAESSAGGRPTHSCAPGSPGAPST